MVDNWDVAAGLEELIRERMTRAGIQISAGDLTSLTSYFGLLTKWNTTINLTALDLEKSQSKAIDKLLVEPFAAARFVADGSGLRTLLDVGSGGGSPAIPLRVALGPDARLHMVESKSRKAAFLREAVRQLELAGSEVHNSRLEDLSSAHPMSEAFDLVSIRAVRADQELWKTVSGFLKPGGRVLWFRTSGEAGAESVFFPRFLLESVRVLLPGDTGELAVLKRL